MSHKNGKIERGDILVAYWGYGQTNVTFWEVVGRSAKTAQLRRLHKSMVGGGGYEPTESMVPVPGHYLTEAKRFKVKSSTNHAGTESEYVNVSSFQTARLWNGRPAEQTNSIYGH